MPEVTGLIAKPDGSVVAGRLAFGERIERIERLATSCRDYVVPGLIDLQVNGTHGMDVMSASVDDLTDISRYLAREGVTTYLPTAITASLDTYGRIDRLVGQCRKVNATECDLASIAGLHLEGPFISAQRLGVHPPMMLEPAGENLERVLALEQLRLITLAPELPGVAAAIERFTRRGVAVSIGHTDASMARAQSAIDAGARMFTHVFNAMRPLHHRDPGVVTAALRPSPAFAAVIPDGIHVHPQVLALVYRARGAGGMILTSDKIGADPSDRGGLNFTNGKAAADGLDRRLAGSLVPLLDGVRLMAVEVGTGVGEAAMMAATNPARLMGMSDRGRLEAGCRADMLLLDPQLKLKTVFIAGRELE